MCDVQKGVCACIGKDCPLLTHVEITDEQKINAEKSVNAGECACLCESLVKSEVITENTKNYVITTYQLKKEAKHSFTPSKLKKIAGKAKKITNTVVTEFLATTENFVNGSSKG